MLIVPQCGDPATWYPYDLTDNRFFFGRESWRSGMLAGTQNRKYLHSGAPFLHERLVGFFSGAQSRIGYHTKSGPPKRAARCLSCGCGGRYRLPPRRPLPGRMSRENDDALR